MYKEDTSVARLILLDEPKVEVYFFPYLTFLTHAYIPPFLWLDHPLLHFVTFFKLMLSRFLSTTP